jgi:hypothetical protein
LAVSRRGERSGLNEHQSGSWARYLGACWGCSRASQATRPPHQGLLSTSACRARAVRREIELTLPFWFPCPAERGVFFMGKRIRVGAEVAWRKRISDPAVGGRVACDARKQSSGHRAIEPRIRSDARLARSFITP